MKRTYLLAFCLSLSLLPGLLRGESIFDRHDRRAAYLFVDNRGRKVGDLITVIINERTAIDQKEKRALDKKSASGASWSFASAWSDGSADQAASGSFDADSSSNRSFDGAANFNSQRDMSDQMTVTIIDVLPNGNLLIEGIRRREVSSEDRDLRITGMIRPADVSVTNVIESRFIAGLQFGYVGRGVDTQFVNQGWFSRAVNRIWPF